MSWIHMTDLLALLETAVLDDTWHGAYNFTAPEPLRNTDFTALLAAALNRPAFMSAPGFMLRRLLRRDGGGAPAIRRCGLSGAGARCGFAFEFAEFAPAVADALGRSEERT